ncbi:MAG: ABC transporter ATP-binding protein [Tissierellia bacterium]|nr:ABC transporter ATP-binding protein [Tissierellia bacterium]MDD4780959.1 ABC transporter ATP-binding protein [Tissierellia bacterium]
MFLEISNLTKKYNNKTVVSNVSFGVEEGELLTILGPSGCGKTTILKALGGFVKSDDGKVILDGIDITDFPAEERPVSTVFQSYGLFPHMSVIDNVIYGLKFIGIKRKEAEKIGIEMLKKVHLQGEENKRPSQLSGGQQQRVAVARGLVTRPKLLLLDEPLSNLDAKLRLELRSEIKAIQREFNITTIFVTHDQEEAFSIADKIMLMNKGELIQFSRPRELYENPTTKFSLDFIGSVNYDEKNSRFSRLEDVYFDDKGEEMEVLDYSFKGQIIEYTLLTSDGTTIRTVSLNRKGEFAVGEKVNAIVNWSPLDKLDK